MPSFKHKRLIERIVQLDDEPEDTTDYSTWIKSGSHLTFLRENANEDELIIYGCGNHTFVHGVVVNEDDLYPLDRCNLLQWNGNPFTVCASYVYGGGRDDVWIERTGSISGSKALKGARQLVFCRNFEGMSDTETAYIEILQEYAHITEIYWRSEQRAYCRFDERGNLDHVVSVTSRETQQGATLISFKWDPLEQYLAVSNSVLVRMFDFALFRRKGFTSWPDGLESTITENDALFYRQKIINGYAGYTRGIQIIPPVDRRLRYFHRLKGIGRRVRIRDMLNS